MSCPFTFTSDISSIDYCASGVMYVSLDLFRSVFQFTTTEIVNNSLPENILDISSADIQYDVSYSLFPIINSVHAMMDASLSEGIIYTSSSVTSNLLKHDFIYYLASKLFGTYNGAALLNNKQALKISLEEIGWSYKTQLEQLLINADNSGNGLDNLTMNDTNITWRLLKQVAYHAISRLDVSSNGISNVTTSQPVPFQEGDTISFFITVNPSENAHELTGVSPIPNRKYQIILYLTNDVTKVNTIPVDSVSGSHAYIDDDGVP